MSEVIPLKKPLIKKNPSQQGVMTHVCNRRIPEAEKYETITTTHLKQTTTNETTTTTPPQTNKQQQQNHFGKEEKDSLVPQTFRQHLPNTAQ